jgi:hypothetical protein
VAGAALSLALVGCGGDSAGEKGGYTKSEFVKDFKEGFGTEQGIPEKKVDCIGGEVFDNLPASTIEELEDSGLDSESDMPDEAKSAFASAFADCLDVADLLAAGGAADGMDVECLSTNIDVSRDEEVEFWTMTLNDEEPTGAFVDAMTEAAVTCATGG